MHPSDKLRPNRSPGLAQRASAARSERLIPQRAWRPAQRRQRTGAPGQACECRDEELSIVGIEASVASRPEAQRSNGTPAGGRRFLGNRPVARS